MLGINEGHLPYEGGLNHRLLPGLSTIRRPQDEYRCRIRLSCGDPCQGSRLEISDTSLAE